MYPFALTFFASSLFNSKPNVFAIYLLVAGVIAIGHYYGWF